MIHCALKCMDGWKQLCFRIPGHFFAVGTYVDNLFSTGFDVASATKILDDAEDFLLQQWCLNIGDDSKMALPALGADDTVPTNSSRLLVSKMRCLGHILSSTGSIDVDFDDTVRKMWGCFYGNMGPGLRNASPFAKLRFLKSCVQAVASFRWSRWPYQSSYASRLDGVQTSMISQLFPFQKRSHEDALGFFLRRARLSGRIAAKTGRWSTAWRKHTLTWHEHVKRAHDVNAWSHKIYSWKAKAWLQEQRFKNAQGGVSGRTRTRGQKGRPASRWFEGHAQALKDGGVERHTGQDMLSLVRETRS